MWNRLTDNTSVRAVCIIAILSWLTWSVSWAGVTGLAAAERTHVLPEPLFVMLFALLSLLFMASGYLLLVLHGSALTLAASLACLGICAYRVRRGTASWRMVVLAAVAVLGHSVFLLAEAVLFHPTI